jgi:hypothetical protein
MRIVRKAVVLGFAGFGMYKAGELANAKVAELRRQGADAKARIEPALHDTEETLATAAEEVSESVHELSHTVADSIATATSDSPADPALPRSDISVSTTR